jgi:hypothetical protein
MALRLTRFSPPEVPGSHTAGVASLDSPRLQSQPAQDSATSFGERGPDNILELPKASSDFVGYWGGYVHSSIESISAGLTGSGPDRLSVVFGRQGDTVFMSSELYSSPNQRIVQRPKARILSPRVATIEYESADPDFIYICHHTFRLNHESTINYQATIGIYRQNSRKLMGVVIQRATLRRFRTARDQLRFARPGRDLVPRAEVSARSEIGLR